MAYATHIAAALSGTTMRQLSYWRTKTGSDPLLLPELSSDSRTLYSFCDVVALRTMAYLREEVSLQRIRKAVFTLRDLGNREHLAQYTLVAADGSIVLVTQSGAIDLVKQPGQQVMAEMSEVLAPFVNANGVEVPDLFQPREQVSVDQEVLAGYPVIAGTRIPFDLVAGLVSDGVPPSEVAGYYAGVSEAAAEQAADYASYVESLRSIDAA